MQEDKYAVASRFEGQDSSVDDLTPLNERHEDPAQTDSAASAYALEVQVLAPLLPERRASWQSIAFLLIADIVGTGVLALSGNLRMLGWSAGIGALLLFYPINLYSGLLLARCHMWYPKAATYIDLGHAIWGEWGIVVGVVLYTYFVFVLGIFHLTLTKTAMSVFYASGLCQPVWGLLVTIALLPSLQLQSLHDLGPLAVVSMVTVTLPVLACIASIVFQGRSDIAAESASVGIPSETRWVEAVNGISGIVFAYSGQSIYPNLLAEMKRPEDFPKACYAAGPYMVFVYLASACTGYYYLGADAPFFLVDVLDCDWVRTASGVSLFVHMVISYAITSEVLTRAVQLKLSPHRNNGTGWNARLEWFGISGSIALLAYCLANAVPFFDDFTHLSGSLQMPFICFLLPGGLYWTAAKRRGGLSAMERPAVIGLLVIGAVLLPVGLAGVSVSTWSDWNEFGWPFACYRLPECCPNQVNAEGECTILDSETS
ncbi:hypothetical protein CYMTET_21018 [Cymbomonas tetramitiformis]|uniref:Amino acid transporter transmembrane domain-containing protein n=1 Tax=Cymbomonas tetramitiformis TaxID=36881 RepID=A0AAE0L3M6_9CHLO|nr:hypothetical protein CYMTET_21018 [Cymbomonas tetramitiformis]|eukprot:gene21207-25477_t